jgi:hypothetical protein
MTQHSDEPELIIIGTYQNGCFCERPTLPHSERFNHRPRFEFRKEATKYATLAGLVNLQFGKGKVAFAELMHPCHHHDRQYVRIDWTLWYARNAA